MKHLSLLVFIFLFSIQNLLAQDCTTPPNWTIVKDTMPGFSKQHDLFFASELVGYTTGVRGTMRKTIDGGKTWEIIHGLEGMGTRAIMKTLYFVDELVGFASGEGDYNPFENIDTDAEFLSTQDGGLTWEKTNVDSIARVNDLKFFNALHGLAICHANDGTNPIAETFDAGDSWTYLDTKVRSATGSEFIIAGERVLIYGEDSLDFSNYMLFEIKEDGVIDYSLTTPPARSSFYFYNEDIGFASTTEKGYKTIDGGVTWTEIDFPITNLWSIVHFADENNGIVANTIYEVDTFGWETWWYPVGLEIFATSDGAETWQRYESGELCAIEGRLSHSSKNGEVHFHAGNDNGTYIFDPEVSLSEDRLTEVNIYPNPVSDFLYVNYLPHENFNAGIFNLAGQKIYDEKATTSINTQQLAAGYYILKLINGEQRLIFPFVKQ